MFRFETHSFIPEYPILHWKPSMQPGKKNYDDAHTAHSKLHSQEKNTFPFYVGIKLTLKGFRFVCRKSVTVFKIRFLKSHSFNLHNNSNQSSKKVGGRFFGIFSSFRCLYLIPCTAGNLRVAPLPSLEINAKLRLTLRRARKKSLFPFGFSRRRDLFREKFLVDLKVSSKHYPLQHFDFAMIVRCREKAIGKSSP